MMAELAKETVKSPFGQTAASTQSVQFKGRPGSLEIQLDTESPLLTILAELRQLLEKNQQLLGQASLSLNFGDRPVDLLQYNELRRVIEGFGHRIPKVTLTPASVEAYLEGELGISVQLQMPSLIMENKAQTSRDVSEPAQTAAHPTIPMTQEHRHAAPYEGANAPSQMASQQGHASPSQGAPLPFPSLMPKIPANYPSQPVQGEAHASAPRPDGPLPEFSTQPEPGSENTRPGIVTVEPPAGSRERALHKVMRTCRAGTLIDVEGDVVVFGDLNPGAEIRATGDIIVFGALRGMAHAGSQGNTNAIIAAFELSPTQLRLANQIAIAPADDNDRPRTKMPIEIAYLNPEKQIEVEACQNGKFPPVIREMSI